MKAYLKHSWKTGCRKRICHNKFEHQIFEDEHGQEANCVIFNKEIFQKLILYNSIGKFIKTSVLNPFHILMYIHIHITHTHASLQRWMMLRMINVSIKHPFLLSHLYITHTHTLTLSYLSSKVRDTFRTFHCVNISQYVQHVHEPVPRH